MRKIVFLIIISFVLLIGTAIAQFPPLIVTALNHIGAAQSELEEDTWYKDLDIVDFDCEVETLPASYAKHKVNLKLINIDEVEVNYPETEFTSDHFIFPHTWEDKLLLREWIQENDGQILLTIKSEDGGAVVQNTATFRLLNDKTPPSAPVLRSAGIITDYLEWEKSTDDASGVKGYKLNIKGKLDQTLLLSDLTDNGDSFIYTLPGGTGLIPGQEYLWHAVAVDNAGNESAKPEPNVIAVAEPDETVSLALIEPADGTLLSSMDPIVFKWSGSQSIVLYKVYIDEKLYASTKNETYIHYPAAAPLMNGVHNWQVVGFNKFDKAAESELFAFNLQISRVNDPSKAIFVTRPMVGPNPFNAAIGQNANIICYTNADFPVKVVIYNRESRNAAVKTILTNGSLQDNGTYKFVFTWDGTDSNGNKLGYGVYPYLVRIGNSRYIGKITHGIR